MNEKRLVWLASFFAVVLVLFALIGSSTQTALMQSDTNGARKTAVSQQGQVSEISQEGYTAVFPQSVDALIPDGSFEDMPSKWTEEDSTGCLPWIGAWQVKTGVPAHHGTKYFWGGGVCVIDTVEFVNNNSVTQTITIPTETPAISFWYWADRLDPDTGEDIAYVQAEAIDFQSVYLWTYDLTLANNTNGWVNTTLDLSDFAGKEITLRFGVSQGTSQYAGNMYFDSIEFGEPAEKRWVVDPRNGGSFSYTTAAGTPVTDLDIPAGAVDKETTISYTPASSPGYPLNPTNASPLGPTLTFAGIAFDLEAFDEFVYLPLVVKGNSIAATANVSAVTANSVASPTETEEINSFQFNSPITIKMHYNPAVIGVPEGQLKLYYWDGDSWEDAALTCPVEDRLNPTYNRDEANNWFELNVCHFSRFGMAG